VPPIAMLVRPESQKNYCFSTSYGKNGLDTNSWQRGLQERKSLARVGFNPHTPQHEPDAYTMRQKILGRG